MISRGRFRFSSASRPHLKAKEDWILHMLLQLQEKEGGRVLVVGRLFLPAGFLDWWR